MTEKISDKEPPAVPAGGFVSGVVDFKKRSPFVRRCMLAVPARITPNGVTVFRGLLLIPTVTLLMLESYWTALVLLVAAIALDFVDGALAEVRGPKTELGAFLDPLADKLLICVPLITLVLTGPLATLSGIVVTCAVTVIEVALIVTRIVKKRRGIRDDSGQADIKARSAGKFKLMTQAGALFVIVIALAVESPLVLILGVYLMAFAVLLGVASFASHLPRRKKD
jgi:phosphatidylglycerophosphate synthase